VLPACPELEQAIAALRFEEQVYPQAIDFGLIALHRRDRAGIGAIPWTSPPALSPLFPRRYNDAAG
jgi:hypothetical protein